MQKELLTKEDYIQILEKDGFSKDVEFIKAEIKNWSDIVEGYLGDHYNLKIYFKKGNKEYCENYFIKTVTSKSTFQYEMARKHNVYGKEIYLYDFLFKEYQKAGYYTRFAPQCYLAKDNNTIVLENLTAKNFKLLGREKFYDVPHCEAALKALAYYHGASISYEERKSKELNKIFRLNEEYPQFYEEVFYRKEGYESTRSHQYMQCTIDSLKVILDIIPKFQEWKDEFITRLKNYKISEDFNQNMPFRKVNGHGDLWSNNMLFRYEDEKPVECCLLDFQLLRYGHPGYDVSLVICVNTRKQFRDKHMDYLINYYHNCLKDILLENGCNIDNILPIQDFQYSVKRLEFVAKFQAIASRTLTMLPAKMTSDAVNSGGDHLEEIMFDKRAQFILQRFTEDATAKELFTENLLDLKESLFTKEI